jgi:simple sugar transport system permease protein
LTFSQLSTAAYLFPELGVLSLGMMLSMITGGIDLTVVSVADLSGILCCLLLKEVMPTGASTGIQILILIFITIVGMAIGALCGLFTGSLIAHIGIPPMLATLGAADIILGLAVAITNGASIKELPMILSDAINTNVLGFMPMTTLVFTICALFIAYIMQRRSFGFKVYMLGANPKASRYSGVNNKKIIIMVYVISGILSAISGILMCGHFNSARSDFGRSYTMPAILACVLAGVNPKGGFGKVGNIVLAVIVLQVLQTGISMFSEISSFYKNLLWGLVLLIVISVDVVFERRRMEGK